MISDCITLRHLDVCFDRVSGGKWPDTPTEPDDVEITAVYERGTETAVTLDDDDLADLREEILQHIADNE